jgi:hypothetical protein
LFEFRLSHSIKNVLENQALLIICPHRRGKNAVKLHAMPKKGRIMRLRSVSSGIKPEFPLCAAQHGLFSHLLLSLAPTGEVKMLFFQKENGK